MELTFFSDYNKIKMDLMWPKPPFFKSLLLGREVDQENHLKSSLWGYPQKNFTCLSAEVKSSVKKGELVLYLTYREVCA